MLTIWQVPAGRAFFLTPRSTDPYDEDVDLEFPLSKIVAFTEHKDTIRRGGVASTIKSVNFASLIWLHVYSLRQ